MSWPNKDKFIVCIHNLVSSVIDYKDMKTIMNFYENRISDWVWPIRAEDLEEI